MTPYDDSIPRTPAMRVRTPQDLGLAIKERRLELGLDQSRLAKRLGVSRQWIVAIEKGKARAEIGLLLRTLRELELDVWVGPLPTTLAGAEPSIDLDQIIERARGKSDGS